MPFCTQCGAYNPDSARFCDQCGTPLVPVTSHAPQPDQEKNSSTAVGVNPSSVAAPTVSAGPDTCPQCGMSVISGQAFCDECGAPLLATVPASGSGSATPAAPFGGVPPQMNYPPPQPIGVSPMSAEQPTAPPQPPVPMPIATPPVGASALPQKLRTLSTAQLIVYTNEADVALPLPDAEQALVGRSDPVSQFYPDIDLAPYGAIQAGVGRRHLRFLIYNDQIAIEDLDSTNGSFLNKQRLTARTPHPVQHGDELRLGRMTLKIHLG